MMKFNYKCKEHDGKFTCDDTASNKDNLESLKKNVSELHAKRSEGHNTLRNKLSTIFSSSDKFKVVGRMKTPQSIQEKMQRKGISDPSQFDDISGLRIVTKDANATQEAIKIIKNTFKSATKPGSEDNYIENPKETGYHAFHVTIMENNEPHEVQVRTERFNEWAEKYHSVYKGEEWTKSANTPETKEYFRDMADVYSKLDNGEPVNDVPDCPGELVKLHLCL